MVAEEEAPTNESVAWREKIPFLFRKSFLIVTAIIVLILVGAGGLFLFSKSSSQQGNKNVVQQLVPTPTPDPVLVANNSKVAPTANPKLKPQFTVQGTIEKVDSTNGTLQLRDSNKKAYTIILDQKTQIYPDLLPESASSASSKPLTISDIKVGSEATIIGQNNLAGTSLFKALYITVANGVQPGN